MKLRNVFIYFLFFIPTFCDLIPNDRIFPDSDSIDDFNLVEGITYRIVHLRSNLNLDGNDDGVYANSVYSPWILRKANDQYNIIDVKSGLNLDCDGQKIYVSSSKDHSTYNPYQSWRFTKVRDNIYNIVHVNSGLNLDSNGKDVYISSPGDNSMTNIYQQWLFEPSNYNLTAVVMDIKYPSDLKDKLEQYKTRTSLLSGTYIIRNDANITIEETVDKTELKLNSYTVEVRKSESFKSTKNTGVSFNIGRNIFGLLGINTGYTNGITRKFSSLNEKTYQDSVTEAVSYHILQKITVNPFNSVRVDSSIDKISINVPFKAKIRISGKADRLDDSGLVVSMTDVEINALRCFLSGENYDIKKITVEEKSLLIDTEGTLKVDGYGLETEIQAITILHEPKDAECPNPGLLNNPKSSSLNLSFYAFCSLLFINLLTLAMVYKLYIDGKIGRITWKRRLEI